MTPATEGAGTAITARSTGRGQGGHRGVGGEPGDLAPGRVDGIEVASETTGDQIRQQLPADGAGSPARADDGDRGRPQQPIDGGDVRLAVALLDRIEIGLGCLELHRHPDDAGFVRCVLLEAGLSEDVEHAVVLGEGVSDEAGDPGSYGRRSQVFQQDRADTSPLVVVPDGEGHLGLVATWCSVVAGDGDELLADDDDKRQPVDVVDVGQVLELGVRQLAPGTEEPQVDRLGRQAGVQSLEQRRVRRTDRTQFGRATVGQQDVRLEVGGIASRQRGSTLGWSAHRSTRRESCTSRRNRRSEDSATRCMATLSRLSPSWPRGTR